MDIPNSSQLAPEGSATEKQLREPAVAFSYTHGIEELLKNLNCSLLVSTYQAQRVMTIYPTQSKLSMLMRIFERATGIALNGHRFALVCRNQVWFFEPTYQLQDESGSINQYDVCFVPRRSHVTGDISGHEAAFVNDELVIVNSRFSCLCTLNPGSSFSPFWKPSFISSIAAEDRCHLNGMATDQSQIKYLTALSQTDYRDGWRENKLKGGILMDFPDSNIICDGLCMPHSPRIYRDRLYVLESGQGLLLQVDKISGRKEVIASLPGYARGLAFCGNYAFVGLSKIREKATFGGLPIEDKVSELKCGICIVNLETGSILGLMEFTKGIEELFDVVVLDNVQSPHLLGFEEETINGVFILP